MTHVDHLAGARDALARGDWSDTLALLDRAGTDGTDALELRAQAAYGAGRFEEAVSAWEELHTRLVAQGDPAEAARAAAMVALYLMMDTGLMAPVRGWVRRAERLVAGEEHVDAEAHALAAMVRTYERFMCGDMVAARTAANRAVELGERLSVPPAVVIGRVATARIEILEGRVDDGLDLLDEVGALLMSGAVDPLTTGMMYCELICAAQGLALHDRAREWTEVMERWRHGAAVGGIHGRCRVHRAEMLRLSGPCDRAEEEALAACDELRPWMRREFGWPLVELGTIRLRRGDLAGAEEAFAAADEHSWSPHPGLALLRLAAGDVASASALIAEAIADPIDIPSKERPPFGDLRMAPLLDAQAEIASVSGDHLTARTAADHLTDIASRYASPSLAASAALARARAALTGGREVEAITESAAAAAAWTELGAPFEAARARVVLGDARDRAGDAGAARREWEAACSAFRAFGADGWADLIARRCAEPVPPGPGTLAPGARTATFTSDGGTRTVCFDGTTVHLRELKGFRLLSRLLAEPGREFHALDLVASETGTTREAVGHDDELVEVSEGVGAGLLVLDDQAREAYRRRLAEVDEDIEDATRTHDLGRLALAQHDREYLVAELARAVGLGGHTRTTGGSAERARTSVTRSLRYALHRLAEHLPALGGHLDRSVHTGTYCSYTPDPLSTIDWEL